MYACLWTQSYYQPQLILQFLLICIFCSIFWHFLFDMSVVLNVKHFILHVCSVGLGGIWYGIPFFKQCLFTIYVLSCLQELPIRTLWYFIYTVYKCGHTASETKMWLICSWKVISRFIFNLQDCWQQKFQSGSEDHQDSPVLQSPVEKKCNNQVAFSQCLCYSMYCNRMMDQASSRHYTVTLLTRRFFIAWLWMKLCLEVELT